MTVKDARNLEDVVQVVIGEGAVSPHLLEAVRAQLSGEARVLVLKSRMTGRTAFSERVKELTEELMHSHTGHVEDLRDIYPEEKADAAQLSPAEYGALRSLPRRERLRRLAEGEVRLSTKRQRGNAKAALRREKNRDARRARRKNRKGR